MKFVFYGNGRKIWMIIFLLTSMGMLHAVTRTVAIAADRTAFVWFANGQPVTYAISRSVSPVVTVALEMFTEDMKQVTGVPPALAKTETATIRIVQLDRERKSIGELRKLHVPVDSLLARKESFCIKVIERDAQRTGGSRQLMVVGADGRGTAYGLLELSRLAGVSPWVWWGDVTPIRRESLSLPADYSSFQSPSVEYRGIFLNDEDWSLQPWSWKTFEPTATPGRIGARTYKEIFKLLMRLRANIIWPGMHGITVPFYRVPGAKEAADSCGIVIGTSHCEPMMRNNVGEWNAEERGNYNYLTNRTAVQDYWKERLEEVRLYENFYTLGMRGIHDGAMEGVTTLQEKTNALQQVIDDQRTLLARHVNKEVTEIPQSFVPYKEVLQIMENGLRLPEDVTLVWCDDNYGYMTRLSDNEQQRRSGGAGVYYHLSYWGRPHDYLWLCTTQPGLIYNEMRQAYDNQARRLWIVNVHDLKPAAYDLELFLDMAWDISSISPSTLLTHQEAWLCREFGLEAGRRLLPAMQEFYRLCALRKPEFMGWNQVELDKRKYANGWSPVVNTEFSLTAFGNELDRYLDDYEAVKELVREAEGWVPRERKDAFFAQIKYPVFGAAAMATKMLEAQRARSLYPGNCHVPLWTRHDELMAACARSIRAYQEIRELTDYYNYRLADGKWCYSMCHNPRDLYVFYPPSLPLWLTEEELKYYGSMARPHAQPLTTVAEDSCIAFNACRYASASAGVEVIPSLGHSMRAVSLPKGETLSFDFDSPWEGEALVRVAVIPTQPNDRGDIRFSVSMDGGSPQVCSFKEGFRTEAWKQNVLRGQAIRTIRHRLAKGKHSLTITALDAHVVIDQWMVDFKPERNFYVFPVEPETKDFPKPAHVLLVAGQSNTDGRVPMTDLPDYIRSMATDSMADSLMGQYHYCKIARNQSNGRFFPFWPHKGRWGYDAVVYSELEKYLQEEFYVIKWAVGGTSITIENPHSRGGHWAAHPEWLEGEMPTDEGGRSLLLSFKKAIEQCIDVTLARLPQGYKIDAFLWHQGESDYGYGDSYYENLKSVVEYIRTFLTKKTGTDYSRLPFVFGSIAHLNKRYDPKVEIAMKRLAKEDANAFLIDMSEAGLLSDGLHFDRTSAEYLGQEMYKQILSFINKR